MTPESYADGRARLGAACNVACFLGLGAFVVMLPVAFGGAGGVAFGVVCVAMAFGVWRGATIRVTADDDGLVVRNVFRTARLRWADVEAFGEDTVVVLGGRHQDVNCPVAFTRPGGRVVLLAMPLERRRWPFRAHRADEYERVVLRWEKRLGR